MAEDESHIQTAWLPIGAGSSGNFARYMRMQSESQRCASIMLRDFPEEIWTWHRLIGLLHEALDGDHDFTNHNDRELRARFLLIALSTSKAILDCSLGGLYVQGQALTRHLFETWRILVYLHLNPGTSRLWLSHNGKVPTPPGDGKIAAGVSRSKEYADRAKFVAARIKECQLMAHPSHAMLTAHDTHIQGKKQLGPGYLPTMSVRLLFNGGIATSLVVEQVIGALEVNTDWQIQFTDAHNRFSELYKLFMETNPSWRLPM